MTQARFRHRGFQLPTAQTALQFVGVFTTFLALSGYLKAQILLESFGFHAGDWLSASDYLNLGAGLAEIYIATNFVGFILLSFMPVFETSEAERGPEAKKKAFSYALVAIVSSAAIASFGFLYGLVRLAEAHPGWDERVVYSLQISAFLFAGVLLFSTVSIISIFIRITITPYVVFFMLFLIFIPISLLNVNSKIQKIKTTDNESGMAYEFDDKSTFGARWQVIFSGEKYIFFFDSWTGNAEVRPTASLSAVTKSF